MNNNGVLSFSALVTLILGLIFLLAALQFIFGIFGDVERKIDVDEVDDLATDSETITMHLSSEVTASRVDDTVISVNLYNKHSKRTWYPLVDCPSFAEKSQIINQSDNWPIEGVPQLIEKGESKNFKIILSSSLLSNLNKGENNICSVTFYGGQGDSLIDIAHDPNYAIESKQIIVGIK
ncbi:hypothetical protein HN419_03750 [Candidatus Woesearchaeota archaeon]|jgi:hypothetical protein|nr:hypothetical protein [Candidatus Woesearchaeota archaeon]MBT3538009.1 hypothetical protein [Candidatus Woesearchaeota archaeon]MBT4698100.1 hypothetical protein [Candidatus Woesearchaeota archaeon]MBT4717084.1 hypothetical protein [Candidatus Woesearchaeota archaeon]MBT7105678.1 hypothetical protein [Candidatus Woesearchaeota archaeon]